MRCGRSRRGGGLVFEQRVAQDVIKGAAFSPDGRHLAVTGNGMAQLLVFDTQTWAATTPPNAQTLRRVVILADGSVIGQNYGTTLHRWIPTGDPAVPWRHQRRTMDAIMLDLAAPPTGERALMVDERGWITEITPGAELDASLSVLWTQPGLLGADASADGRHVYAIAADRLLLLDRSPGAGRVAQIELRREIPVPGTLRDVALSPDERLVAIGAIDGHAYVFRAADNRLLATLSGHTEPVAAVEFASAARLLTASWDHSARVCDLSTLDTPAQTLIRDIRHDWGITLQDALSAWK